MKEFIPYVVLQMDGNYRIEPNGDEEIDVQEPVLMGPLNMDKLKQMLEDNGFDVSVIKNDEESALRVKMNDETAIVTTDNESCTTDIITSSDSLNSKIRNIILSV